MARWIAVLASVALSCIGGQGHQLWMPHNLLCTWAGFYWSVTSLFPWAEHKGTPPWVRRDKADQTIILIHFPLYSYSHQYGSKGDTGCYKEVRSVKGSLTRIQHFVAQFGRSEDK